MVTAKIYAKLPHIVYFKKMFGQDTLRSKDQNETFNKVC